MVISGSGNGIGRRATRAKALISIPERLRVFENPLPRTKSPGLAQLQAFHCDHKGAHGRIAKPFTTAGGMLGA